MFPVSILLLLVQAACIVHVIKTGRNMLWIWAIFLLPGLGALAYLAVEILPELFGGRTARRAGAGVRRMIDPDRGLRRASAEVEISGNVDARRRVLKAAGHGKVAGQRVGDGLQSILPPDLMDRRGQGGRSPMASVLRPDRPDICFLPPFCPFLANWCGL